MDGRAHHFDDVRLRLFGSRQMGNSSGKLQDPEVFTWDYGTVHKSDIQSRKQQRQLVRQFLSQAVLQASSDPTEGATMQRQIQAYMNQRFPVSDEKIVEAMLLEKKAKQLGINVSDETVNQTLRGFTQDRLRPEDMSAILRQLQNRNGQVSQADLFEALRNELAVMHAEEAFSPLFVRFNGRNYFFRGDTPGDRWDYFCRLNRKVTAEMLPVPVENFVGEISDPSAVELQKFYDQYKNTEPQPGSPTPGFRQPFKAKFQYVKADYDKMLAVESPKITEQQIKGYYDEHKEEFKKTKLPDLPLGEGATEGGSDASKDSGVKAPDKKTSEKPADTKSSDAKANSKSSPAKPDAKKTDDKKSSDKKSSDGKQSSAFACAKQRFPRRRAVSICRSIVPSARKDRCEISRGKIVRRKGRCRAGSQLI